LIGNDNGIHTLLTYFIERKFSISLQFLI